jgi:hypothetical protein
MKRGKPCWQWLTTWWRGITDNGLVKGQADKNGLKQMDTAAARPSRC